ncbi:hypothetical protein M378DRAFT_162720 [Amanita muscaria Koide BX008]|uniref:Uncharacterized protein n=1 Tax=Amanita muscaria (strain Koide BX008) TaxID=946122 RepID=A0A0C2TDG3_AMAMK|nr:hypothetical protein M378DRAFT_162720 [Amanita muscaria Koide BX008]
MPAVSPGSNILVTGASGYVATYLIQELLDQALFAVHSSHMAIKIRASRD